jgi:hypothetical protein
MVRQVLFDVKRPDSAPASSQHSLAPGSLTLAGDSVVVAVEARVVKIASANNAPAAEAA